MQNLIIAKSAAGVVSFQKSSNGTLTDGKKYTGQKITIGSENGQFIVNNDGDKMYFGATNVYYNGTNYTSTEELLEALATDGISVNFNSAGATAQIKEAYISIVDSAMTVVKNDFEDDFSLHKQSVGVDILKLDENALPEGYEFDLIYLGKNNRSTRRIYDLSIVADANITFNSTYLDLTINDGSGDQPVFEYIDNVLNVIIKIKQKINP